MFICYSIMLFLFERKENMEKRIIMFLFVITFLVLSSVVDVNAASKTLSEVDRKLKFLNKPAIKSIKVHFSTISTIRYPLLYS